MDLKESVDKYIGRHFKTITNLKSQKGFKWSVVALRMKKEDPTVDKKSDKELGEYIRGRFRVFQDKVLEEVVERTNISTTGNQPFCLQFKENRDKGTAELTDKVSKKLDDKEIYEKYNVDQSKYKISQVWYKDKSDGKYIMSVLFTTIKTEEETVDVKKSFDFFIDKYNKSILQSNKIKTPESSPYNKTMYLCTLADLHIGNYQKVNYIESIKNRIFTTFDAIAEDAIHKLVILNTGDLIHTDTSKSQTWNNTQLDSELSFEDAFTQALELLTGLIEYAANKAISVTFINVRGNHSFDTEYCLGEALKKIFSKNKNIEIINSKDTRIYYQWENNGFLFTHGDKAVERLPLLFATEGKEVFKYTDNHHIILGHLHHNKSKQFVTDRGEFNGIEVRIVGSPTSNDVWHKQNGFCQNKKALVGFLYTEEGKVAEYNYKI